MEHDMKEGDTLTRIQGVVTRIADRSSERHGRRPTRATITVAPVEDDTPEDEYSFDVPKAEAQRLRLGQQVGIEIKVLK